MNQKFQRSTYQQGNPADKVRFLRMLKAQFQALIHLFDLSFLDKSCGQAVIGIKSEGKKR